MNVCHLLNYNPHSSGLYESARELIEEEVKQGINARFLDVNGKYHPYLFDRGAQSCDIKFLASCDLVVMHQMIHKDILATIKKPIILVLHGTPRDCFWSELYEGGASYSTILKLAEDKRFSFITLWERHLKFWSQIMGDNVSYIPPCVNLERFHPGIEAYDFPGWARGKPNILFGDTWRIDKNPFEMVHAFKYFKKTYPEARLQVFCKSSKNRITWNNFFSSIFENKDYYLGEYDSMILDFPNVVKACDFVITPQRDATRIVRESLAIGTPVVGIKGEGFMPYGEDHYWPDKFSLQMERCWEDILDMGKPSMTKKCRYVAEAFFNVKDTVELLKDHFEMRLK